VPAPAPVQELLSIELPTINTTEDESPSAQPSARSERSVRVNRRASRISGAAERPVAPVNRRARTLKQRTAAVLTPRVSQRHHVETIVAEVAGQSDDDFSSVLPIESSKPQGRLQRLWSKVVSVSKKWIASPVSLFTRNKKKS